MSSVTIAKPWLEFCLTNLSDVIITLNKQIELKKTDSISDAEFLKLKQNLQKIFSVFETINFDKTHHLYSIKTLKNNLKNHPIA